MDYEVGVQSYTYREFSVEEICSELKGTGISAVEFCGVHIEPGAGEAEVARMKRLCSEAGLAICGYGVHNFAHADADIVRGTLEFAAGLGADYVSVDFPPDAEDTASALIDAAEEFDLRLAIHNHGPGAMYSTVDEVLSVCEKYPPPLGACVDTGHYLRSGQTPREVISRLGDRVYALHLKDFNAGGQEVVPGRGEVDLQQVLELLSEHTELGAPLVIEYEEDPEDPTPAVLETVDRLRSL